jgi:hypothetical protein
MIWAPFDAGELTEIADALDEHLNVMTGIFPSTTRQRIRELRDRARLLANQMQADARRAEATARVRENDGCTRPDLCGPICVRNRGANTAPADDGDQPHDLAEAPEELPEPTDDEIYNGHGMEGGISFVTPPWNRDDLEDPR